MARGMGIWTVQDLPQAIREDPRNQAVLTGEARLPSILVELPARPAYWPYRSQLEYNYAALLDTWQAQGLLRQWQYESHRLTLAPKTTLTIDWYLWMGDGTHQLHETKGTWYREDGWQKLKQAAALFPGYRFFRVQYTEDAWRWQEVPSA